MKPSKSGSKGKIPSKIKGLKAATMPLVGHYVTFTDKPLSISSDQSAIVTGRVIKSGVQQAGSKGVSAKRYITISEQIPTVTELVDDVSVVRIVRLNLLEASRRDLEKYVVLSDQPGMRLSRRNKAEIGFRPKNKRFIKLTSQMPRKNKNQVLLGKFVDVTGVETLDLVGFGKTVISLDVPKHPTELSRPLKVLKLQAGEPSREIMDQDELEMKSIAELGDLIKQGQLPMLTTQDALAQLQEMKKVANRAKARLVSGGPQPN